MTTKASSGALASLLFLSTAVFPEQHNCKSLGLDVVRVSVTGGTRAWQVYIRNRTGDIVAVRVDPVGLRWRLQMLGSGKWKDIGNWGIGPGAPEATAPPPPKATPVKKIGPGARLPLQQFDLGLIPADDLMPGKNYRFIVEQDVELVSGSSLKKCTLISKPQPFIYRPHPK